MSSTDPQPGLRFLVKLSNRYGRHAVNAIIASEGCKAVWLNTTAQTERSGAKPSVLPRPLCSPHAPFFRSKLANSRSIPFLQASPLYRPPLCNRVAQTWGSVPCSTQEPMPTTKVTLVAAALGQRLNTNREWEASGHTLMLGEYKANINHFCTLRLFAIGRCRKRERVNPDRAWC